MQKMKLLKLMLHKRTGFGYLTELANLYQSDKGTKFKEKHGYTKIYEKVFRKLRDQKIDILEIGLCHRPYYYEDVLCPSLKMWFDYFPNANIFGFDLADFSSFRQERTKIFKGDQGKKEDILKFINCSACEFDIIIDDGGHASAQQQISLATLFPYLKGNGLYVIEDLHWQPIEIEKGSEENIKTRQILKEFKASGRLNSPVMSEAEIGYLVKNISECKFYKDDKLCILFKK